MKWQPISSAAKDRKVLLLILLDQLMTSTTFQY
jgi:hypothetical protein